MSPDRRTWTWTLALLLLIVSSIGGCSASTGDQEDSRAADGSTQSLDGDGSTSRGPDGQLADAPDGTATSAADHDAASSREVDAHAPGIDAGAVSDLGVTPTTDAAVIVEPPVVITAAGWGDDRADGSWTDSSGAAFGYKRVSGPLFQITARVVQSDDHPSCRVGLMIRGALEDDGAYGAIALTEDRRSELAWRSRGGSADAVRQTRQLGAPYWLRLKRVRGHVRGFYSADGRNWLMQGYGPEVELPEAIYIGLQASGRQQKACLSGFDNVQIDVPTIAALDREIAPLPPMGWNSWNHIGPALDAQIVSEMIDAFVSRGLRDAGYTYVNLDDYWQKYPLSSREEKPLTFNDTRFPQGIAALADKAHSVGLKLGIYSGPGNETCAEFPASAGHEREDAQTWADWGIDYLKYDCCCIEPRTRQQSIGYFEKMRDALAATSREMVLSVVNCGVSQDWTWAGAYGHLWRTNVDIYDSWVINGRQQGCGSWGEWSVLTILDNALPLWPYYGFGNYNDLDMLVYALGEGSSDVPVNIKDCNGGMTRQEYRSHFTLWAILGAPLLHGADLRNVPQWAIDTITNPEVIALNQDPLTLQAQLMHEAKEVQVIAKALEDGSRGVAVLNRASEPRSILVRWGDIGLPAGAATVRDLWSRADRGSFEDGYQVVDLPSHATAALRVTEAARPSGIAFEAEAAALEGDAEAERCVTCFGGGYAAVKSGSIAFEHVYAPTALRASLTVYSLDTGAQSFELTRDGAAPVSVTLSAGPGANRIARHRLTVDLHAGDNTLRIAQGKGALAIDRIVVDTGG